ncbi:ABC transporter ATP-binding protein [Psychromicrobium xiongbiense]|uniref:ABC transporter ATP-binding protein n=1 Tax=Psychromicrobium xiongbiense TaxID=3051184 RepID=UPI00255632D3|nr:ABC transporter ATP-binding protein [Psychromicrobium sp. YIM S02556]
MSAAPNHTSVLAASNLGFRYPGAAAPALEGITLDLPAGVSVGLVGESGSGKSTIVNLLLGLQSPSSGSVTFRGAPLNLRDRQQMRQFRRTVQPVFQDPYSSLDPRLTIGRSVSEPLIALGLATDRQAIRSRVEELLLAVGLEPAMADRYPAAFSGGQRQRIAIARALAPEPQVILADEPVSALDVSVRMQVIDLLRTLAEQRGLGLLLVSHDLTVIGALCQRLVVLANGRMVEQGETAEVLARPQHAYTRKLLTAVPRLP